MFITFAFNDLFKFSESLIRCKHFIHFYKCLSECLSIVSVKKMRIFLQFLRKFFFDEYRNLRTSVTIEHSEKTEFRVIIEINHCNMSVFHEFSPTCKLNKNFTSHRSKTKSYSSFCFINFKFMKIWLIIGRSALSHDGKVFLICKKNLCNSKKIM